MSAVDDADFDPCGPLPTGVTVLEASAGTGKTYTIAALVTRYVAEGIPLDELLVVSFTRAATGELRDRVRERLSTAREALDLALTGERVPDDELLRLLADGSETEVAARRERLARANADFDAATVTTTHGFCREVLGGLGVAGDMDRAYRFSEDAHDLLDEVIDDLYICRFLTEQPPLTRAEARAVGLVAIDNPSADIEPAAKAQAKTTGGMRYRLAERVRYELERRKRSVALMTYDDLVTRLQSTLEGGEGTAIAQALRRRYRVALIDEFQDTDPDQWTILREAFAHDGTTLVLIGDPKQAIYSFRGAEVYSYLAARDRADARPTLRTNWRSDQGLLEAYNALFRRARLGHEDIVYRHVQAAEANQTPRLSGAPASSPLRIRVVSRADPKIATTPSGCAEAPSTREYIAKDVAADAVALLDSAAQIETRQENGSPLSREAVQPGDIAVLTRTNSQAALIKAQLDAVGVPAVVNGAGSVFGTGSARDWLRLLDALERPDAIRRTRGAALTRLVGWTTEQVACATDDEWDELQQRLHRWAKVLRDKGVAALLETVTLHQRVPGRLLAEPGGERVLTDLRHVGELLHVAAVESRLGVTALAGWLRQRMAFDDPEANSEDRARRLESDAEAVQILTVHRSKGLEFPVVYCPYLWDVMSKPDGLRPAIFHDAANANARTIDLTMDNNNGSYRSRVKQAGLEELGEELRLAYVALSRAKHQAVIWWAGSWHSSKSPLHRLVFDQDADGNLPLPGSPVPTDSKAFERFEELGKAAPGQIAVERATVGSPERWTRQASQPAELTAARFTRPLDRQWRRTSYTSITAGAYEARVASEIEEAVGADDAATERPPAASADPASPDEPAAATVPLSQMPVGARVGSFVHRVLEATDFAADDLDAELAGHVTDAQRRRRLDVGERDVLVAGLRAAIETPLGPLGDDLRLRDLEAADRLDELAFELPLVGGDAPTGELTLEAIAVALDRHLSADDPLAGYPDRLADPSLRPSLRGFLVGTIDLVARNRQRAGQPAFSIVDYKTNRLAPPDEPLTAWHHRQSALAHEMQRSHYALQALLYAVALHRYLRWRVPGYDPLRDRPTILYLFLRGMTGRETPAPDGTPNGVFAWRPPAGLIPELSDLLDRGTAA